MTKIDLALAALLGFTLMLLFLPQKYTKSDTSFGEYTYEEFTLPNEVTCFAVLMNNEPLGIYCPNKNETTYMIRKRL